MIWKLKNGKFASLTLNGFGTEFDTVEEAQAHADKTMVNLRNIMVDHNMNICDSATHRRRDRYNMRFKCRD